MGACAVEEEEEADACAVEEGGERWTSRGRPCVCAPVEEQEDIGRRGGGGHGGTFVGNDGANAPLDKNYDRWQNSSVIRWQQQNRPVVA